MNLDDLRKPFDPSLISWRVGATNKEKTSAIALAYIDARDVMQRLDEVCGVDGWQNDHPHANGKTSCRIGIKINDEWVWRENGCGDSDIEAAKGAFSDSFKRAAVLWGIGRYLYDVPNVWVDIVPYGRSYKIKNQNDPKLLKALNDAEKGIRGVDEDAPEPTVDQKPEPQKTTKEDDIIKWIAGVKHEIKACTEVPQIGEVLNKHIKEITKKCNKAQQDHINDFANKKLNELAQTPIAEAAE